MALDFYPAAKPHDYIRYEMENVIPAGQFYVNALESVPRSSDPQQFILETTTLGTPVRIYINNVLTRTIIPNAFRTVLNIRAPFTPNSPTFFLAENGIDAPVHTAIAVTYQVTLMDAMSSQLYEVADRINEKYSNLFSSPWSAFIIEWLIPWQETLQDVRSFKSMGLKAAANCLFGESAQDGGVKGLISSFISSTPVVTAPRNPEIWQPYLYQPQTSGDDATGFDIDVWIPNLCLNRWGAFVKYIQNIDFYEFVRGSEDVVVVRQTGTEFYSEHTFDNTAPGCSVRGVLDAMGCMDFLVLAGTMQLNANPSLCYWAEPFDMQVEYPGIGGLFFDSGTDFDGGFGTFDSVYDIDILTDYWVGTSLSKKLDGGSCFDVYSNLALLPKDQECCMDGPDTKVLTTSAVEDTVASAVKPNHPLYGGDDPGLLANPYFQVL